MAAFYKKATRSERELRRIQRHVVPVNHDIEYLSNVWRGRSEGSAGSTAPNGSRVGPARSFRERLRRRLRFDFSGWVSEAAWSGSSEDRFTDYLSGSVESARPVSYHRRVFRHRIVLLSVCSWLVVYWAICRFF